MATPTTIIVDVDGGLSRESQTMAFDRKTGRLKWQHGTTSSTMDFPILAGGTLITQEDGLKGLDPETGRLKWKSDADEESETAVPVDGDLILCFSRTLLRLDPGSGKVRWTYRLRTPDEYDLPVQALRVGDEILVGQMPTAAIGLDGKVIWRAKEIDGDVLWADDRQIVTNDLGMIHSYMHGVHPTVPTTASGRRALASELVDRFDSLDTMDKELLVSLGEPAFDALLHATISRAEALVKNRATNGDVAWDGTSTLLAKVITDRKVPVMIDRIRSTPVNGAVGMMLLPALLSSGSGNERELVTLCLWVLSKEKPTAFPGDESSIALSYLRVCTDIRAQRYVHRWDRAHPRKLSVRKDS